MKMEGFKLDSVPIWVRLSNIPYDLWTDEGLSHITSLVGKPLEMDTWTYDGDKLHFAKVYVEVNLTGDFPSEVEVILEDDSSHFVQVEYLGKPVFCSFCQRLGHEEFNCRQKKGKIPNRDRSKSVATRGRSKQRKIRSHSRGGVFKQVWQKKPTPTLEHQNNLNNFQATRGTEVGNEQNPPETSKCGCCH